MKPKVIAIVGTTAAGKSSLGIKLAKQFDGEIVSVDSRQVYRGMNIGTAKVLGATPENAIKDIGSLFPDKPIVSEDVVHWGIDLVDPDQEYSVSDFKGYAEKKISDIVSRGKLPILVGGTGFWLKALIDNFDLTNTKSDQELRSQLESRTLGDLFHEYKQLDPEGAETIERENKRRVVRALEVTKLTGIPFSKQQTTGEYKYDVLQIGLLFDRETIYERVNIRVDSMIANGLVDEVRGLRDAYGCEIESMTGIGYRQICRFLSGVDSLEEAIEEIKKDTRRYAKRQMTWFKRDERIVWIDDKEKATELVDRFIH